MRAWWQLVEGPPMVSRKLWREGIREGRVGSAECEGKTASEGRKETQGEGGRRG